MSSKVRQDEESFERGGPFNKEMARNIAELCTNTIPDDFQIYDELTFFARRIAFGDETHQCTNELVDRYITEIIEDARVALADASLTKLFIVLTDEDVAFERHVFTIHYSDAVGVYESEDTTSRNSELLRRVSYILNSCPRLAPNPHGGTSFYVITQLNGDNEAKSTGENPTCLVQSQSPSEASVKSTTNAQIQLISAFSLGRFQLSYNIDFAS